MFQIISIITLIAVLYFVNAWKPGGGFGQIWQTISKEWQATWRGMRSIGSGDLRRNPAALKQFCKRIGWFSFGLLAISGFLPVLLMGGHLSGYPLLLHMLAAPILLVAATLYLVMSARNHEMNENDWQALGSGSGAGLPERLFTEAAWRKVWYWGLVILFIPAIVSIALGMYDMFGTEGQEMVLTVHGYTTLALTAVACLLGITAVRKHAMSEAD